MLQLESNSIETRLKIESTTLKRLHHNFPIVFRKNKQLYYIIWCACIFENLIKTERNFYFQNRDIEFFPIS